MKTIVNLTLNQLLNKLSTNLLEPNEIIEAYKNQPLNVEDSLKVFLTKVHSSSSFPYNRKLYGLPYTLGDNICTQDIRTTCGSLYFRDYVPFYSAKVHTKLSSLGGFLLGKANMAEFSIGKTNNSPFFSPTLNPYNFRFTAGPSGGSCAAVSSNMSAFSIASDINGSLRSSASYCGVVAFRPTKGLIPSDGIIPLTSSYDQVGIVAKDVLDVTILFDLLSDAISKGKLSSPPSKSSIKRLKIALVKEHLDANVDPDIAKAFEESIKIFQRLGLIFEEISLPFFKDLDSLLYLLSAVEIYSNFAGFDGLRYGLVDKDLSSFADICKNSRSQGFGDKVKEYISFGALMLSKDYHKHYLLAKKLYKTLKSQTLAIFDNYFAILSPTLSNLPYKLGEEPYVGSDKKSMDIFTSPASLFGLPSINLPFTFNSENLPIGMQLTALSYHDNPLLSLASNIEKEVSFKPLRM